MHINNYGIKLFGNRVISIECVEDLSALYSFDIVMVAQVKPDNYGNGRIDVSIQQSNEQSLELHNGWSVKRIYAGWDWNRYRTYIDLIDSFGIECSINTEYYKSGIDGFDDMMIKIVNQIIELSSNYNNVVEHDLVNTKITASKYKGTAEEYEKYKQSIRQYWETYTKFVENPIYQANTSDKNREKINANIHTIVDKLLNYTIVE